MPKTLQLFCSRPCRACRASMTKPGASMELQFSDTLSMFLPPYFSICCSLWLNRSLPRNPCDMPLHSFGICSWIPARQFWAMTLQSLSYTNLCGSCALCILHYFFVTLREHWLCFYLFYASSLKCQLLNSVSSAFVFNCSVFCVWTNSCLVITTGKLLVG